MIRLGLGLAISWQRFWEQWQQSLDREQSNMTILQKAKILAAWNKLNGLLEELEVYNSDPTVRTELKKIMGELEDLL